MALREYRADHNQVRPLGRVVVFKGIRGGIVDAEGLRNLKGKGVTQFTVIVARPYLHGIGANLDKLRKSKLVPARHLVLDQGNNNRGAASGRLNLCKHLVKKGSRRDGDCLSPDHNPGVATGQFGVGRNVANGGYRVNHPRGTGQQEHCGDPRGPGRASRPTGPSPDYS